MRFPAAASAERRSLAWLAAVGLMILCYASAQIALTLTLETAVNAHAIPRDLVAHCLVAVLLFATARSFSLFAAAVVAVLIAFHLSNGLKLEILGAPIMPDDFTVLGNLFLLLEGWALAGAAAIVLVPGLLLAAMVDWRARQTWGAAAVVVVGVTVLVSFPSVLVHAMDNRFGNTVWNQRDNYESRGLVIHLIQESARNLSRKTRAPSSGEVEAALKVLGDTSMTAPLRTAGSRKPRNVHMLVLESFWDPAALGSGLSGDPLDPRFRTLWGEAGHSQILSPVFGGYTANAEFEALCGFPVTRDSVFFEGGLRREAPCLPRHLEAAGYLSFASHPNSAAFWNRTNAYRRIGFDTYWSKGHFLLDDMNGSFLSDESLYLQVMEKLQPVLAGPVPVFNYVLTYLGHLPYPLNDRRPKVITTAEDNAVLESYANTLYYKSRELMTFLDLLRAQDPDALIVLFGDHPPFLGPHFGTYTDSGLLARKRGDFSDAMFRTLVATPLVVIDGRRGPLDLGEIPMYRVPALILALLGDPTPSVMRLGGSVDGASLRPLPGLYFLADGAHVVACRDGQPPAAGCQPYRDKLKALETLTRDVFSGDQHTLRQLPQAVPPRRHGVEGVRAALVPAERLQAVPLFGTSGNHHDSISSSPVPDGG